MAEVYPKTHDIVAHLAEVKAAVANAAEGRAKRARAALAPHRRTRQTEITVETRKTDTIVSLVNPKEWAAVSIEFGHVTKGGTFVDGLHILGKAFGL